MFYDGIFWGSGVRPRIATLDDVLGRNAERLKIKPVILRSLP